MVMRPRLPAPAKTGLDWASLNHTADNQLSTLTVTVRSIFPLPSTCENAARQSEVIRPAERCSEWARKGVPTNHCRRFHQDARHGASGLAFLYCWGALCFGGHSPRPTQSPVPLLTLQRCTTSQFSFPPYLTQLRNRQAHLTVWRGFPAENFPWERRTLRR